MATFSLAGVAQQYSILELDKSSSIEEVGPADVKGCCGVNSQLIDLNHPLVQVYSPICAKQASEESCQSSGIGAECSWYGAEDKRCESSPVEPTGTGESCCNVNPQLIKMNHPLVKVYQPICLKQLNQKICVGPGTGAECAWSCK